MFRFALALPVAGLIAALAAPAAAQGWVFYNTLDSDTAIVNSQIGPDLRIESSPLVTRTFVPAVEDLGMTVGSSVHNLTRCTTHNLFLDDPRDLLDTERGTIQFWVRIDQMPSSICEDTFRLFGGPFDQLPSGIGIWVANIYDVPRLQFELFPSTNGAVPVLSIDDYVEGASVEQYLNRWVKVDALWDRTGIDGLTNPHDPDGLEYSMALFFDGELVAGTGQRGWYGGFGTQVGIGGWTGIGLDDAFVMDELKIWDNARIPVFEPEFFYAYPGCPGSAGVPSLAATNHDGPLLNSQFTMTFDGLPVNRTCLIFAFLGFDRDYLNGTPLPLDLSSIGAPGCMLYLDPDFDALLGNHLGHVEWSIYIPDLPALVGMRFFTQGLVLDPAANPLGASFTNACEARIGNVDA